MDEDLFNSSKIEIKKTDPSSKDAKWCFGQYFKELNDRFESGFDPAQSISANTQELTPPEGLLLVAFLHDEPVGCGALKFHGSIAEVKRMWVAPGARGLGLGKRLLIALENSAREANIRILRLETNRALAEAISLYRSSGFVEVRPFNDEPYAHHWFEKRL